ncbi:MAG TPA: hypothetical protein VFB22_16755 [Candidatus Baltobacteraceae bacterium]|nr:hypothetical protein [Candidatus Baltobacteraceae bacterium]
MLDRQREERRPELVFGLIGALGADIGPVIDSLEERLQIVGYRSVRIKLSALMESQIPGHPFVDLCKDGKKADVEAYMDAGTQLRTSLRRGDALAMYGVLALREERRRSSASYDEVAQGLAYIFDSLKHDDEVETLRRIYGQAFVGVGVYTPYRERLRNVSARICESKGIGQPDDYRKRAEALIEKDFDEQGVPFGQHVSDAFALSDVFISSSGDRAGHVARFVQLLFGDWTKTPTRDEIAMFHAYAAALESSSMARQVGAAIALTDGTLLATGTNELPRFGGGPFDADEARSAANRGDSDIRDFALKIDASDTHRRELLTDILGRLASSGRMGRLDDSELPNVADDMLFGADAVLRKAKFMSTIDYVRTMHAETMALSNCARRGIAVEGGTLYVTTFPCHDCAKQLSRTVSGASSISSRTRRALRSGFTMG